MRLAQTTQTPLAFLVSICDSREEANEAQVLEQVANVTAAELMKGPM